MHLLGGWGSYKALISYVKKGFVDFQMVATVHTFIYDFKPNIIKTHQNNFITSSVVMIERNRCVRIVFYSLGTKIIKIPNKTKWYNWENSKINNFEFPLILKTYNQKINNIGDNIFFLICSPMILRILRTLKPLKNCRKTYKKLKESRELKGNLRYHNKLTGILGNPQELIRNPMNPEEQ